VAKEIGKAWLEGQRGRRQQRRGDRGASPTAQEATDHRESAIAQKGIVEVLWGLPMEAGIFPRTDEFLTFVRLAEPMTQTRPSVPPAAEFQQFIEEAKPFLIGAVYSSLRGLAPRLALIRRWLITHDLLSIAGFAYDEDPYTELIAWALDPATHLESAIQRQRAWLSRSPFAAELDFDLPATPRTQLVTQAGIPDMVLQYERFAVVLEAKTGTGEHRTPRGDFQTIDYPPAVKQKLGLPDSMPVRVVFLTPERREAANPNAFNTTFVDLSLALADVLEGFQLSDELRHAYAMLFTHFLTCATPLGADLRCVIQDFVQWENRLDDESFLMGKMNEIEAAMKWFSPEAYK